MLFRKQDPSKTFVCHDEESEAADLIIWQPEVMMTLWVANNAISSRASCVGKRSQKNIFFWLFVLTQGKAPGEQRRKKFSDRRGQDPQRSVPEYYHV